MCIGLVFVIVISTHIGMLGPDPHLDRGGPAIQLTYFTRWEGNRIPRLQWHHIQDTAGLNTRRIRY